MNEQKNPETPEEYEARKEREYKEWEEAFDKGVDLDYPETEEDKKPWSIWEKFGLVILILYLLKECAGIKVI